MEHNELESGQALVLIALGIITLIAFMALAIDGGRLYALRREAQGAVDAIALAATYAQCHGMDPEVAGYEIAALNGPVASTAVINIPPLSGVNAGNAQYIEATITADIPSTFAHLIFKGPLRTTVLAEGRCSAGGSLLAELDVGIFTIGDCPDIKAFDGNGSESEIIGGLHSNDDIYLSGQNYHFHGPSTYVEGYTSSGSDNWFAPGGGSPGSGPHVDNPLGPLGLNIQPSDYGPGGSRAAGIVHDLSSGPKVDMGRLDAEGLYDPGSGILVSGIYYAGDNEIDIGDSNLTGEVTFVSENQIKIGGSNSSWTPYIDDLLIFSNKQPSVPCKDWVVDIGGSGNPTPDVDHDPDDFSNPVVVQESDNIYRGLIYAPRGLTTTSGSDDTFLGAILSQGVRLSGSRELIVFTPGDDVDPTIELTR